MLSNIGAMETAVGVAADLDHLELADLLYVHRELMSASGFPELGGIVRTTQNWIGGSSYNPCSADFGPPPPDAVQDLLADLLDYVNGRCGRALIHVVLRRRGLAPHIVPPLSLILASSVSDYVGALTAFR